MDHQNKVTSFVCCDVLDGELGSNSGELFSLVALTGLKTERFSVTAFVFIYSALFLTR